MSRYSALLACYLSGQVPEAAWSEHIAEDAVFAAWLRKEGR